MFDPGVALLWLENNPEWIIGGIFFAAFLESFAVIGLLIPGVALLALISAMAGTLNLPLPFVLLFAYLGACMADIFSFLIGRYFQNKLDNKWPFVKRPHWLLEGRAFIKSYGVIGIFLGRFIGPVRALLPLVAGSLGKELRKFILIDLFSGIFWASIYMLPGYFAGKSIADSASVLPLTMSVIAAAIAVYLASRFKNLRKT